jgi:chromate transporter
MLEYLKIFIMFAKIGLFTFGGGLAMFPMFKKELVEKGGYVTEEDLIDYYSIGQCTPGIIAINVATFTGYRIKRTKGAVVATLGVVFPCLVIIMALAGVLNMVADNEMVNHAFSGIRIGVTALLANEMIGIFKKSVTNKLQLTIMIVAFVLVIGFKISSIVAVMLAGIWAVVSYLRNKK